MSTSRRFPEEFGGGFGDREVSRDEWLARNSVATVTPEQVVPIADSSDFGLGFQHECVEGSAIAIHLYVDNVKIVRDTGMWEPNRELNQHVSTQYQTHRPHEYKEIALFVQESGENWQGKPKNPKSEKRDGKPDKVRKSESIKDGGSTAYRPAVNRRTRRLIARYYRCEVPPCGESFWDWLEAHPKIEIVITEGGKKSLCLFSMGVICLALYGVRGGYAVKDRLGNPIPIRLIPCIARFATGGRKITIMFDQDTNPKTVRDVNIATSKFGGQLVKAGCEVKVASWDGESGNCKGVDDLRTTRGSAAVLTAISEALPFSYWQIQQRLKGRLTDKVNLKLNVVDLSVDGAVENLPQEGIIAIASGKGTGKTKLIAKMVANSPKVLSIGHRIALQRNLCERLSLDYRGDLDRLGGRFVNSSGYAQRIGVVVDSSMAIDPVQFEGCDLVIDEVCQVLRHLLSSSTCAKDGKRPALLSRFVQIVKAAKRIFIADADLDNAILSYFAEIRGDGEKPYILKNDYQVEGYPVEIIDCPDKTAIVKMITDLTDGAEFRQAGKAVFISTDHKITAIDLENVLTRNGLRVLCIHSKSSSGQFEQEFIKTPDQVLPRREYDVFICSPSVATGVSIETQGIFHTVFGIYTGVSIIDGDMAQSLARVRENVPRVVWCEERGSNLSKISRSTNPIQVKEDLRQSTLTTASITRSLLREDDFGAIESYDWQSSPHLNLWAKQTADSNRSMLALKDALVARLKLEGNQVTFVSMDRNAEVREMLKAVSNSRKEADAETLVAAQILNITEVLQLEGKESTTPDQMVAIERFYLCNFYKIDPQELTIEDVLADKDGRRRGELLSLESQMYQGVAADRTVKSIEKQKKWNQGICPWDIANDELRRALRERLDLNDFLNPDRTWTKYSLQPYATKAREMKAHIKTVLHLTISDAMSDTQIIHQFLSQMGIKVRYQSPRNTPGHEGERVKVYRLDESRWSESMDILERRRQHREELAAIAGEVTAAASSNLDEALIVDCVSMAAAAADSDDAETIRETLLILSQSLSETPESKQEVWARLSLEHRERFRGVMAA